MLVQEAQANREVEVNYVRSEEQLADMLTKPMSRDRLKGMLMVLGMVIMLSTSMTVESRPANNGPIEYQIVLYYINPCDEMLKVDHDEPYPYGFWYYRQEVLRQCNQKYDQTWVKSVDHTKNCTVGMRRRYKRDLTTTLVSLFGSAVSNFITSRYQPKQIGDRNSMVESFNRNFDINREKKEDADRYVSICSESGRYHTPEIQEQAQQLPGLVWSIAKTHGEMLANTANLNTVSAYCRQGKVAPKELGELLDFDDLVTIDPEKTTMLGVDVGDNSITFRFVVNFDEEVQVKNIVPYVLWVLSLVVLIAIYLWKEHLQARAAVSPPQYVEEE